MDHMLIAIFIGFFLMFEFSHIGEIVPIVLKSHIVWVYTWDVAKYMVFEFHRRYSDHFLPLFHYWCSH